MFEIDLLQGQGVPMKSRPEGIAIVAVTFVVPIIVAIVIFGAYLRNRVTISIQKKGIDNYQVKIEELADALKMQKSFEREKSAIKSSLAEVDSALVRHTQWSPVLVEVVKNMPDSVVLTSLNVMQHFTKITVPKKSDPEKTVEVRVPVRTLRMSINADPQSNSDRVVKDFRDSLRASTVIGPKLEDLRVSQQVDTFLGREVISYEIDCVFKPGL